jgi:glycosyltransferase involved in cell wall biosynthesis
MDAHNFEGQLYPSRGTPWSSWLAAAVARSEREAWHLVDLVFATTDGDAEAIRSEGVGEVVVVPNAADLDRFRPTKAGDRVAQRRALGLPVDGALAVFVGSAHPPNVEALEVIERQAAAYASEDVGVVVVGRVASRSKRVPNVTFAGEVPDVARWLGAADIAVNPMLSGSGSNLKMMEYLAAGLPVVTTEVGARGLDLRVGLEAEVCDVDSMPGIVGRLAADPGRREAMAQQARLAAEERFGWAASGRTAAVALRRLVDSSSSHPR